LKLAAVHLRPLPTSSNIKNKKADAAEHPEMFDHIGLLANEPTGIAGLLFI
jgi:hypothetical protein